jgi:TrmH family RNA methyltransferase
LRAAVRLKTTRGRKTQQRVIIFGHREVMRAIASGIHPLEVFLSTEMLDTMAQEELLGALRPPVEVFELPRSLMARLRYGEREEGVVAIAHRPALDLHRLDLAAKQAPLVLILESIEKPGNIGAVLRSADGAGADAMILVNPRCDVLHPNAVRASLGSVFTIPLAIADADEAIAWCARHGLDVVSLTDRGSIDYTAIDWRGAVAMVFGNEAEGLTARWLEPPCRTAAIPMLGISDSLNISVAAGVALYEARRQRTGAG